MTAGATESDAPARRGPTLAIYVLLAGLTAAEVAIARTGGAARERTTALAGLLLAKAGILLAFSLRATPRVRRSPAVRCARFRTGARLPCLYLRLGSPT